MLARRPSKTEFVESRDLRRRLLEPPHAAYYQPRPGLAGALRLIGQARADFLSIWRESDYAAKVDEMRLFGRQIVLVNAPDAIRHVVAKRHDNYERKSPQMRRALEHLIGDGLFISDGETWRSRRPLVSDIVRAKPLEPISLKGISRKVVPYVVETYPEDGAEAGEIINEFSPGARIFLDIGQVSERERERLAAVLKQAMDRLQATGQT